jgi:hypothetical protein
MTNLEFRYPGLASFTTEQRDLFFGRKRETRELFHLISVEKTVVLFSKSGLGKTSLLNAGVIPLLAENRIWPVPIRFGTEEIEPEWHFKFQFDEAYRKFIKKEEREALAEKESFWEQIKSSPFLRDGETWTPLLIFDQFEELFTLYPQPERRARFVQELADLIQERLPEHLREALFEQLDTGKISPSTIAEAEKAPPLKIVFSIRSDMLHFMDELSEQIPFILRSRYQLFGLAEEQAREAIVAPAALPNVPSDRVTQLHPVTTRRFATEPFGYTEEALHEIIGTLTKNREVESFQLQAVCQALEEKMSLPPALSKGEGDVTPSLLGRAGVGLSPPLLEGAGGRLITPDFYGGTEGIARILEESYQRRLDSLEKPEWKTPAARLLEDALVNENGRRRSVDVADLLARPGVTPDLLDALERQRLVRKEPRLDSFYYEISHDTLLAPIVKSRRAREAEEEKARAAAELEEQKRQAEATRRRLLVLRGLLAGAVVALAVAVLLFIRANNSEQVAVNQKLKVDTLAQQLEEMNAYLKQNQLDLVKSSEKKEQSVNESQDSSSAKKLINSQFLVYIHYCNLKDTASSVKIESELRKLGFGVRIRFLEKNYPPNKVRFFHKSDESAAQEVFLAAQKVYPAGTKLDLFDQMKAPSGLIELWINE